MCIFTASRLDTFARREKYLRKLNVFRSLIRIFALSFPQSLPFVRRLCLNEITHLIRQI